MKGAVLPIPPKKNGVLCMLVSGLFAGLNPGVASILMLAQLGQHFMRILFFFGFVRVASNSSLQYGENIRPGPNPRGVPRENAPNW